MAGFLSHLVQRTLAASPAILPRLAGPYEGSRDVAAKRDGDEVEEAITALDLARERAGPQLEPTAGPEVPSEGSAREPFASGSRDLPANKHYQPEDPTMPAYAADEPCPISAMSHWRHAPIQQRSRCRPCECLRCGLLFSTATLPSRGAREPPRKRRKPSSRVTRLPRRSQSGGLQRCHRGGRPRCVPTTRPRLGATLIPRSMEATPRGGI